MIRAKTNHRQPTLAADLGATVAVLACVVDCVRDYSRSDAAQDFAQVAAAGYGDELDAVLTRRLPAWLHDRYGVDVDPWVLRDAFADDRDAPGHLDDLVDGLRGQGWDAERLLDSLVYLETAHHQGLVLLAAGRLAKNSPQDSEEFMSFGWLGLRVALRKFDPGLGNRFSTYAMTRITGAIRDGVRDEDPLPKRLVTERNKAVKAGQDLADELGRTPTLAELSSRIGDKLAHMLPRLARAASLDELSATFTLADPSDIHEDVEAAALADAVNDALGGLEPDTRTLAELVFRDGMSVRQASDKVGLPASAATARLADARASLAGQLADWA